MTDHVQARLTSAMWLVATLIAAPLVAHAAAAQAPPPKFAIHAEPKPLPEIGFVDGAGRKRSLADFRGRTVLLNIWATWCVPCRKEMPSLDRLQGELGAAEFEVVALSIDRGGVAAVRPFYAEIGIERLGIYVDPSGRAAQKLGVVGIPTTLLIGRDGREIGRFVGPAEWDAAVMVAFLEGRLKRAGAAGN
jgi:thiol-disulfide isomerase/thioredoxin